MTIAIDPRMTQARSSLIMQQPFYGSLAMRLQIVQAQSVETMATDGTRLYYNPAFLAEIDDRETQFVIAHEVLHCALGHHVRRNDRDPKRWNIACDYVVNRMLERAGFKVPKGAYINARFDGFNAEEVYRILENEDRQQQQQQHQQQQSQQSESGDGEQPQEGEGKSDGDDQPGEGGEPQSHGDPGRCGEILDAAPEGNQAALDEAAEEWGVFTRQAINVAKRAAGHGDVPGFVEEVIADMQRTRTDWREVLRRFIEPSTTKDYTWTSPNKRLLSLGHFAPGMISDGVNHVALIIDTSGSIDQDWLRRFGNETQTALDEGAIDKITLVFTDTRVNRTAEYHKGDQIDFTAPGRGGTAFAPSFEWLNENAPDIAAAIYFTDLDCNDFGDPPAYPVLWAVYGDPRDLRAAMPVPFGEIVELTD